MWSDILLLPLTIGVADASVTTAERTDEKLTGSRSTVTMRRVGNEHVLHCQKSTILSVSHFNYSMYDVKMFNFDGLLSNVELENVFKTELNVLCAVRSS